MPLLFATKWQSGTPICYQVALLVVVYMVFSRYKVRHLAPIPVITLPIITLPHVMANYGQVTHLYAANQTLSPPLELPSNYN